MRQLIDERPSYSPRLNAEMITLPRPHKGTAQRPRKPKPVEDNEEKEILREFAHVYRDYGIPVELWDRKDMVLLAELAKALRKFCHEKWLVRPGITEGDTVAEAIAKVRRLRKQAAG